MGAAGKIFVSLAVISSGFAVAAPAWAAQPSPDALPITVLGVKSDDALDQAEALTSALKTAVLHAKGWSLGDNSGKSVEEVALQLKPPCKEPQSCEAAIADFIKADRFVWTVLKFTDAKNTQVVGQVNMFVRGKGTRSAEVKYAAAMTDATDDHLVAVAEEALNKVTGGPPQGGVKIATGGVAGQLYVDDKPMGPLPAEGGTYQVAVGDHTVTIKAPGFQDASTPVHVAPLATVDAIVTMVPAAKEKPVDGRMVGGFVSLAVGAGLGGVGLWAALDVNTIRNDESYKQYRAQLSPSDDTCGVASSGGLASKGIKQPLGAANDQQVVDFCSRAHRDELIQAVVFPLAGVAAGVGAYLLGTSSLGKSSPGADKPSAWSIDPVIGPSQQSLNVRYRF
jgi:hypothetical protein